MIVAGAMLVGLPFSLSGGVFSGLGTSEAAAHTTITALQEGNNSQNIALLKAARHVDPNPSKGGGDISIVDNSALEAQGGPAGVGADALEPPKSDQISVYVVREGDALSQIAQMFDVSPNTIRWANDIGVNEPIQPGQTLVILPINGVRYEVEKGDTLASIAKEFEGDVDEIKQFNGITDTLAVGETIVIPHGEISSTAPSAPSSGSSARIASGGGGAEVSGYFIRPVEGRKTQGRHGYNAVDIGAPVGTPVIASAAGEVIVSRAGGWNGGYGNFIVIKHANGTQTLYAHNNQNIVYAGQNVVQGQVIGYVGSTGRSTGPHLHFEVRGAANPF